jgi:RNA polymerase sigma-70 factor (ECF subfamily)
MVMAAITGRKRVERQTVMTRCEGENADLIQRACTDPDAFAQLYLLHYDTVFRHCSRRLFDRHGAEEVTSTVFFKIMRDLGSFRGNVSNFRSWMFRITSNAVNDYLRDAKRRREMVLKVAAGAESEATFEIDADEGVLEKKALLKRALLELKPKYQTVIALRFFENMKLTEIADCLEKNPSTVRNWLVRAIAKLRKRMNAELSLQRSVS